MDEPQNQEEVQVPAEENAQAAPCEASAPADSPAPLSEGEIAAVVEAILFTTDSPMPPGKIAQVGELPGVRAVREAVRALNDRYRQMGCAFAIEEIGGGYQMLTQSRFHDVLERLTKARSESKLSQAALEALAIIAYRQPILRADVEAIRGVACGEVLRGLLEKNLVKIVGRAEVIGRPMLYGTTRRFMEVFGLSSLEDLPRIEELRSGANESLPKTTPAAASPSEPQPAPQTAPDSSKTTEITATGDVPETLPAPWETSQAQ